MGFRWLDVDGGGAVSLEATGWWLTVAGGDWWSDAARCNWSLEVVDCAMISGSAERTGVRGQDGERQGHDTRTCLK